MSAYPVSSRGEFLAWCQAHVPVFDAHAPEIGLSMVQAGDFHIAAARAEAAVLAQEAARQAALVATREAEAAMASLKRQAGRAVKTIRAFAATSPSPETIYAVAAVAPVAGPTPIPSPAQPHSLTARLDASAGTVKIRWKATQPTNARGTVYLVRRRLPGEAAFSVVGVIGEKSFVDDALPAGAAGVQYTVQGQRGRATGPASAILSINFGRVGRRMKEKGLAVAAAKAVAAVEACIPEAGNFVAAADGRVAAGDGRLAAPPRRRTPPRNRATIRDRRIPLADLGGIIAAGRARMIPGAAAVDEVIPDPPNSLTASAAFAVADELLRADVT